MSSAVLERIVEKPKTAAAFPAASPTIENGSVDPHPLVPVFIAGAISLAFSGMFIGGVLVLLALQNSGVMAP